MRIKYGVLDLDRGYRVHLLGDGRHAWCGRVVLHRVAVPGGRPVCRHCLSQLIRRAEQAPLRA